MDITFKKDKYSGRKIFQITFYESIGRQDNRCAEYPVGILYKGVLKNHSLILSLGEINTYNEIWYYEENDVGYLVFNFYNGTIDTDKCHMLRNSFISARQRKTKVIVSTCGMDF